MGHSDRDIAATPMPTSPVPHWIRRNRGTLVPGRPWIQEPIDQLTAPPVSVRPATAVATPRSSISISGTNVSAPKNDPARTPRIRIAVGMPRLADSVPRGSSFGTPTASRTAPATNSGSATRSRRWPAYWSNATPMPARTAGTVRRRGAPAWAAPPRVFSLGSIRTTAGTISGGTARKTQRQDSSSATTPAMDGPMIAGSTQALAMAENSLGRIASG